MLPVCAPGHGGAPVFANESPQAAIFELENGLYSLALTMPSAEWRSKRSVGIAFRDRPYLRQWRTTSTGGGANPAPTVLMKEARYENLIEAFGGRGLQRRPSAEPLEGFRRSASFGPAGSDQLHDRSGRGAESGHIDNLNPHRNIPAKQSAPSSPLKEMRDMKAQSLVPVLLGRRA